MHKIPILDWEEKNKEIYILDVKSGNQENPHKTGRREKETIASKPVISYFILRRKMYTTIVIQLKNVF